MPTARETITVQDTDVTITIEFQMWCAVCGSGICGSTDYKRGARNKFVTRCGNCEKEHAAACKDYEYTIDSLRRDISGLEDDVRSLERRLEEAEAG